MMPRRPRQPQKKEEIRTPYVLFEKAAAKGLQRGFDQMGELIALTLGPTKGAVLSGRDNREPEVLHDSATLARRIIAVPGRATDVGAMLLRNVAWRVHQRSGDGAATAVVLAMTIFREARRYVAAGGNPMIVRRGIELGMEVALAELARLARPVEDEEDLTRVAETLTAEPGLSLVLGEVFDVLGPTAYVTVEKYVAPYLERAYFSGGRWSAKLESPYLITDIGGKRAIQENCHVVLYRGRLNTGDDVAPLLLLLAKLDPKNLLLFTQQTSGEALGAVVNNHARGNLKAVIVAPRRVGDQLTNDFNDLAVLTGATVLGPDMGTTLADLQPEHLGKVQRVEATASEMMISGGGGSQAARQELIEILGRYLATLSDRDEGRDELQLRLARLSGGVAVVKVGAYSEAERSALNDKAEKAVKSLRLALQEGVVAGGGVAYLQLADVVRRLAGTLEGDVRQGALILARALEEPFLRIVKNRGDADPATVLAEVRRLGTDHVYDALAGRITTVAESGLVDPTGVLRVALETGSSGGVIAMTTAAIVFRKKPVESLEP